MASAMRPKKQLGSKRSPAPPSPQGPLKLFVKFPLHSEDSDDTRFHCIFTESDSVSVTALKARIELLLGLPADAYELRYGEKTLRDTERLRIGRDVSNASLLTACVYDDHVRCVADAVYCQNAMQLQDLFTRVRDQGAPTRKCGRSRSMADGNMTPECTVVDTELAFVAMCLSAAYGHHEMVEVIGHADGDGGLRKMATPFGRTPLHIACANGHDRVVNLLLAFQYDPQYADGAQQTPVTMAQRFEAGLCSLLMQRHREVAERFHQRRRCVSALTRASNAHCLGSQQDL